LIDFVNMGLGKD